MRFFSSTTLENEVCRTKTGINLNAFGMLMPGRNFSSDNYKFGFNGKEKDDEIKGNGNSYDYGERLYDPRLGKFLSVDPLSKEFPWNSTYAFAENDVIRSIDLDGLEKLIIHAQKMESVGGTKIDVQKADFIAYKLSFSIEYPDGKIEQLNTTEPIIMYENKSMQSGSNSANALTEGTTYDLAWGKMSTFTDEQIHIKSNGIGHSDLTYIHPLGTTATADNNPNSAYTTGCKGVSLENSAEMSPDGTDIYGDEPYTYSEQNGKPVVPEDQKANSSKSWGKSYKAMNMIRQLYNNNKDKLQKEDNFELKVEDTNSEGN